MKKVKAIIKPFKLDEVKYALSTLGRDCSKNSNCHSERSEESHFFFSN
jgi:nitrogen regulatory protein PII